MSIKIDPTADLAGHQSAPIPPWIDVSDGIVRVRGDNSLARDTFLSAGKGTVTAAETLPEMLAAEQPPAVSTVGVSHVLGGGFVPLPLTIFDGIYRLGAGDMAACSKTGDVSFSSDYPWVDSKSRQDEVPSSDRLLELIVASLERKLEAGGRQGLLMMSSGLDSVALALGLAELGYSDVLCATYQASTDNREHEHAARFCERLGLKHQTIQMPGDPERVRSHLMGFFTRAVAPCADHAMIPFIVTCAESGITDGAIVDGGGNDGYMGYIASTRRRRKRVLRVRGRRVQTAVARVTRIDSRLNYLARGRSQSALPGRNMRIHEIRQIYDQGVDPAELWASVDRELSGQSDIDRAMRNMVHQIEGSRTPDKVQRVGEVRGMKPVLPYCDAALAEYVFNLPEHARFDRGQRIDKILLRTLLAERLDYDQAGVEKGFFAFDGAPFFIENADFVRDEIRSCDLWEPSVGPLVDRWIEALPHRPLLFHPLISLFMLSGWRNHSPIWQSPPRSDGA